MTREEESAPQGKPDPVARGLFLAMGLALAAVGGAAWSAGGVGSLQTALRAVGFGQAAEQAAAIEAEQRRQVRRIATLEARLARASEEIAGLRGLAAVTTVADMRAQGQIARVEADMETLRTELKTEIAAARTTVPAIDRSAPPQVQAAVVDTLGAGLAQAGIEIGALRSSLDERDAARIKDIAAIAKRVERLEQIAMAREVTGSIRPAPAPQRRRPARNRLPSWSVQPDFGGVALVSDRGGRFHAAPGVHVPGLGRIADVRQRGDRWIVVTRRGVIAER